VHTTQEGQIRGKLAYMSPEQVLGKVVDARTDVFAAAVVLWEALAGRKLFKAENDAALMKLVLSSRIDPPSTYAPEVPREVDRVVLRGLERDVSRRFPTADEMAAALADALPGAPSRKVGAWVREVGGLKLANRAELVRDIERQSSSGVVPRGSGAEPPSAATSAPSLPATQGSSGSVAAPTAPPVLAEAPRRILPAALGAGAGLLVAVIAVVVLVASRAPSSSASNASTTTAATPAAATEEPLPIPSDLPAVASPAVPATGTSVTTAPASASARAAATPAPRPQPPSPGRAPPRTAPAPSSKIFSRF